MKNNIINAERLSEIVFCICIISISFITFSPSYSNLLNSDKAVHILMANNLSLPEDLYFWGQDRLGSLVPILANLLVRIFSIKAITACSLVEYGLLLGIFLMTRVFIQHTFLRILFCFMIFIPFPFYIEQVSLAHPYTPQYFFITSGVLFYHYHLKTFSFNKKALYLFCCFNCLFLSVWISDFSIVFIFCFLLCVLINELLKSGLLKKIFTKTALTYIGVFSGAFLINYLFIHYAKEHAVKTENYKSIFTSFYFFKKALILYILIWIRGISFGFDMYTSLSNIFFLLIIVYLAYSFIKKVFNRTNHSIGIKEIFLLNAVLGFFLLLASNWVQLNSYLPWYFTYAYISFSFYIILSIDSYQAKARLALSSLYLAALISMSFQSFRLEGKVYDPDHVNSLEKVKRFKHIKNCGIIGDYWHSYILSINDPDSIPSTPHDEWAVRNHRIIPDVFSKPKILLVSNDWMESFPDSVFVFNHLLLKDGKPFGQEGVDFCFYKNVK